MGPGSRVIIVTDGWPSALVAAHAVGLDIQAGYIPVKLHSVFKPSNYRVTAWHAPSEFTAEGIGSVPLVLSGDTSFIAPLADRLAGVENLLLHVRIRAGLGSRVRRHAAREARAQVDRVCHHHAQWRRADLGAAADVEHVVGFRPSESAWVPSNRNPTVPHQLRHYLVDTTRAPPRCKRFTKSEALVLEQLPVNQTRPAKHPDLDGGLLPQGLISFETQHLPVLCPSVYFGGGRVLRKLTTAEMLPLLGCPRSLERFFTVGGDATRRLLWECVPPLVYASAFRCFFGVGGGRKGRRRGMRRMECIHRARLHPHLSRKARRQGVPGTRAAAGPSRRARAQPLPCGRQIPDPWLGARYER